MQPAPLPAPVQAFAPDLARRVAIILAALLALIARRCAREPRLVVVFTRLWSYLNRAAPVAAPPLEFVPTGPAAFRSQGYTWYVVPTPPA